MRRIKFQGKDWILVDDHQGTGTDGAITTEEAYRHGLVSYAHLFEDGTIRRYNELIGTRDDVEFGEPCAVGLADDFVEGILCDPGWDGKQEVH